MMSCYIKDTTRTFEKAFFSWIKKFENMILLLRRWDHDLSQNPNKADFFTSLQKRPIYVGFIGNQSGLKLISILDKSSYWNALRFHIFKRHASQLRQQVLMRSWRLEFLADPKLILNEPVLYIHCVLTQDLTRTLEVGWWWSMPKAFLVPKMYNNNVTPGTATVLLWSKIITSIFQHLWITTTQQTDRGYKVG